VSAAALTLAIEGEYGALLAQRRAPLLGPPTINIGLVQGGTQVNMVPPECRLYLDRRTIPGETDAAVFAEMEELLERLRKERPDFRAVQEPPTLVAPPMATDPESGLARAACAAAAQAGLNAKPAGVHFATDAAILGETGIPIIVLGPGSIDQGHTADEYVELDQVATAARLYADLIGREIG
jgi:acetylornithine deacetylase/succinyl-diaminopimelate desuccinylase-like protein